MTALVLLSGGLDSTYLVSKLLQSGPVDVLYVNGGQCPKKIKCEIAARDKLIAKMNTLYPHKIQGQYEILDPTYLHDGKNKKWIQPNAWMNGAFRVLIPDRHSSLNIAYVNDDGAHFGNHLPYIVNQWVAMLKVGFMGSHVPIEFPILHMDKLEILEEIDKRLLDDVWVCELPAHDLKACNKCKPCRTLQVAKLQYKWKHGETVEATTKRTLKEFKAENIAKSRKDHEPNQKAYYAYDADQYVYLKGTPKGAPDA